VPTAAAVVAQAVIAVAGPGLQGAILTAAGEAAGLPPGQLLIEIATLPPPPPPVVITKPVITKPVITKLEKTKPVIVVDPPEPENPAVDNPSKT